MNIFKKNQTELKDQTKPFGSALKNGSSEILKKIRKIRGTLPKNSVNMSSPKVIFHEYCLLSGMSLDVCF